MTKKTEKKSFFFLAVLLSLAFSVPHFAFANQVPIPSSNLVYTSVQNLMDLTPCTQRCVVLRNMVSAPATRFHEIEEPAQRLVIQLNRPATPLTSAERHNIIHNAGTSALAAQAAATALKNKATEAKELAARDTPAALPEQRELIRKLNDVIEAATKVASDYQATRTQLTNNRAMERLHAQGLRSVGDPPGGGSSGCSWCTGAGLVGGAAVLVGGGYLVGNMMIDDAGKEGRRTIDYAEAAAGRVVDSSLDKVEARTAKILADSTKTAQDFINSQITRLRGEVQGLARDGVMALEREVYAAIDRLIENATRQADSVLLAKLQQLRTEAQNFFNEILSNANNFLEQNGVGDFRIDDVEIFNSPATDLERRLQSAVNTAKATGKTGAALQAVCLIEGAKIFNKTDPAALSSAERTAILNLCK